MIYARPDPADPIDQGDIVEDCPLISVVDYDLGSVDSPTIRCSLNRVIVLTQTCDLAQGKVRLAVAARALEAAALVASGQLKAANVKGPIRAGRVFGWYFLPAAPEFDVPELIVDMRQLHSVRIDLITDLCRSGKRLARVQPLYREHLAKHFADTYSRIGLPEPYPTEIEES